MNNFRLSTEELVLALNKENKGYKSLYHRYGGILYGVISKIIPDKEAGEKALIQTFLKIKVSIDITTLPKKDFLPGWSTSPETCALTS